MHKSGVFKTALGQGKGNWKLTIFFSQFLLLFSPRCNARKDPDLLFKLKKPALFSEAFRRY